MVIFHCYVSSPEGSINTSYYQVQTAASLQERHPSSHFFAQFRARKKQCHANVSKNNKKYHMLSYTMVVSFITMNIGIWCIYYHILSYTIIYYHIISYNIIYNIIYSHVHPFHLNIKFHTKVDRFISSAGPPAASWASYLGSPSRPDPPGHMGIWRLSQWWVYHGINRYTFNSWLIYCLYG